MAATMWEEKAWPKTYLINLASSRERLEQATIALRRAGMEFERVAAVDGRQKSADVFREYNRKMARRQYGRPLSGGEVGCFLSHRACVERFLATKEPYALVLEDDLLMPEDFPQTLRLVLAWLDQSYGGKWDVINLGRTPKKYFREVQVFEPGGVPVTLCVACYFPLCTFALLWTREGAAAFLAASQTFAAPVDQFLRDWCAETARGLALTPALIGVVRGKSEIGNTLADRLFSNWFTYWFYKNRRLLRNQRKARRAVRSVREAG